MPSTPLICSSIGVVTVSAITFGLAPGYCARTTTDGGTTSGYSEIGIARSASRPATKISTEMTPAKIGRSMKNLDRFMSRLEAIFLLVAVCGSALRGAAGVLRLQFRARVHADLLWRDQRAGPDAVQAVDPDALAGVQSAADDKQRVGRRAEGALALSRLVVAPHHEHELLVLVGADRALVDHQRRLGLRLAHAQACELPRNEPAVGIIEGRAHAHGAAARIDLVVDQLQPPLERIVVGRKLHADGNALNLADRAFIGERLQRARDHLLVGVEARIDRVHRDERGEDRGARAAGWGGVLWRVPRRPPPGAGAWV